jgi:uncharacterized protein (TIGR02217 family)
MTGFHEVQFQPDTSYGASGGPRYSTTVVTTVSGHERRNANWAMARGRWNVAHGLKKREQVAELIAFFRARRGRAYGFRFKGWTDYQALAQSLGVSDGGTTTFQLDKHCASSGEVETREITKPVAGTVKICRDGVEATSGWSVDTTTGLVTFTIAAAVSVQITTDFAFDVPVRFDSDRMDLTIEAYQLGGADPGRRDPAMRTARPALAADLDGFGLKFAAVRVGLAGGQRFLALVMVNSILIIIGMGSSTTGPLIILLMVAAPALIQLGVPTIPAHHAVFEAVADAESAAERLRYGRFGPLATQLT